MNTMTTNLLALATGLLLSGSVFAADMSKSDYKAAKDRISADSKSDQAACKSMTGNAKDVCMKEAKAVHTKAVADAKSSEKIGEVKSEAKEDKSDADYKVAIEKCDALAGSAKEACVASAKSKYGK